MESHNYSNDLHDKLEDILKRTSALREVTYKYISLGDEKYFNETIFIDYCGLPSSLSDPKVFFLYMQEIASTDQGFYERIKNETAQKLDVDIGVLREYLTQCEEKEKPQIELQITALDFTKNALYFELELLGFESGLSEEELSKKIQLQEELDEKLFGEHVSKNPDFVLESYVYTQHLLDKSGKQLSPGHRNILVESQKEMLQQVARLRGISDLDVEIPEYIPPVKDLQFEELKRIEISREDYMQIFNIFFEVSDVPQRSKMGNYSGYYDGDDVYGIPLSDAYAIKDLEYLLRIGPHEASHYINLRTTQERKDGKQAGDMMKEEGVSMMTEALISVRNIDKMSYMTFAGPSVVMNRLYDGNKYNAYQDAYLELLEKSGESTKGDVIAKTLRKIRGHHKKRPGGTNKDSTYALGMKGILEYIRSGQGDISNLFGGKISLEQMKSGNFQPEDFGNKYIQHILLSEFIFFYLKKRKNDSGIKVGSLHEHFVVYLKEKYKHFSDTFGLFNEAEKFTFKNKRNILKILKIIEKASNNSGRKKEIS